MAEPPFPELWNESKIPLETEVSFESFVRREDASAPRSLAPIEETQCLSWLLPPNEASSSSFGDHGTTATVNRFGEIMQLTRRMSAGKAWLFSLDHSFVNQPYYVTSRADDQQRLSRNYASDISDTHGLRFQGLLAMNAPHISYVNYRWPRYEYSFKDLKLSIQWMVRDDIVLQQCVLKNNGEAEVPIKFTYAGTDKMLICDLDYLNKSDFNNPPDGDTFKNMPGPRNYSWCRLQKLEPKSPSSDIIATVVSLFVDGSTIKWENGYEEDGSRKPWTQLLEGRAGAEPAPTTEIIVAYKMVHVSNATGDWTDFLIPCESVDVAKFLKEEPFSAISLSSIEVQTDTPNPKDAASDGTEEASATSTRDPPTQLKTEEFHSPQAIPKINQSPQSHIEFVIRRHLEHLLSVCAIPLDKPIQHGDSQNGASDSSYAGEAIVLTCGDLSWHRVCTSASFFAFRFLLEIMKRLTQCDLADPYVLSLKRRIEAVCNGHLKWLLEVTEKTKTGGFAANYWINGNIMNQQSYSWRPSDSLTDTPFQVLKVLEYAKFCNDVELARPWLEICKRWIEVLEKSDKRRKYAWPRRQEADANLFRLSDHVWIWTALRSIEDMGLWDDLKFEGTSNKEMDRDTDGDLRKRMAPRIVQKETLRRFTTENVLTLTRMLAVTRSSRETRFLFHSSDTALFYGSDWDYFLKETTFYEVWDNSIKVQRHHDGNQETGWDNAVRYALAILMGTRGHRINRRQPLDLVRNALSVLLNSSSPSGFFPGILDTNTKEPALFDQERDRDFYFHASFEIPFILLTNLTSIATAFQTTSKAQARKARATVVETVVDHLLRNHPPAVPYGDGGATNVMQQQQQQQQQQPALASNQRAAFSAAAGEELIMKKVSPFSKFVDSSRIVEMDEEWLYNYPYFLSGQEGLTGKEVFDVVEELVTDASAGHVVLEAARAYKEKGIRDIADVKAADQDSNAPEEDRKLYFAQVRSQAFIFDSARKRSLNRERRNAITDRADVFENNEKLWEKLQQPRTAQMAKKRIVWLTIADAETALVCYLGSPEPERQAMALFFDRHSTMEKYFFDDTTMFRNTWETEFHLSFYGLLTPKGILSNGIPKSRPVTFPGGQGRNIVKASMGFRFSGDIFDRYWTCHVVACIPPKTPLDPWELDRGWGSPVHKKNEKSWRQRRVLELYLFERVVSELLKSTQAIADVVRERFGLGEDAISTSVPLISNSEDYFSAGWQDFEHMLDTIEGDLAAALEIIAKWDTRDKDRAFERPRWTRNDETKYGSQIKKLLGSTNRMVRDLQNLHTKIRSLKERLSIDQERIRDDLNLRGAEDIRFFTYVTVVFLPLGFAASIFSMSGSPDNLTLVSMVICAVVSLAVTVIALFNAKTLGFIMDKLGELMDKTYGSYSRQAIQRSYLGRRSTRGRLKSANSSKEPTDPEKRPESRGSSPAGNDTETPPPDPAEPTGPAFGRRGAAFSSTMFIWFWLAYFIIEFPAMRVLMAYRCMTSPKLAFSTFFYIAVGIFFLPFCLVIWIIQLLIYNVGDLIKFLWETVSRIHFFSRPDDGDRLWQHLEWLTHPPDSYRPFKIRQPEDGGNRELAGPSGAAVEGSPPPAVVPQE